MFAQNCFTEYFTCLSYTSDNFWVVRRKRQAKENFLYHFRDHFSTIRNKPKMAAANSKVKQVDLDNLIQEFMQWQKVMSNDLVIIIVCRFKMPRTINKHFSLIGRNQGKIEGPRQTNSWNSLFP